MLSYPVCEDDQAPLKIEGLTPTLPGLVALIAICRLSSLRRCVSPLRGMRVRIGALASAPSQV